MLKDIIKNLYPVKVLKKVRVFSKMKKDNLAAENSELKQQLSEISNELNEYKKGQFVPPGHYYSAIANLEEIKSQKDVFNRSSKFVPAVELNNKKQLAMFDTFAKLYKALPFLDSKKKGLRYFYDNPAFGYGDGISLYCMLRYCKPKKIIEVGSGYSSCVTLDVNELNFKNKIDCTFIEPYPELLNSLIKKDDIKGVKIISERIQDIDLDVFKSLKANDILFIDSTHVSKVNSDVNYIFFNILPVLNKGVYIHFHDVFYPFEYLENWIYEGRSWTEDYILRAFLEYNNAFEIIFFNTYISQFYRSKLNKFMPLYLKNPGGSIWIRKVKK